MSKHLPYYVHATYLHYALRLDTFKEKLVHAKRVLRSYKFDAIAIRGMSGALIGVPLAHALKKNILIVRKHEEKNHSGRGVEGDRAAQRYIIADDCVDSGRTMGEMLRAIKKFAPQAVCVGVLEWNDLCLTTSSMMVPGKHFTDATVLEWDEFGRSSPIKHLRSFSIEFANSKETTNEESNQLQAAARSEAEVPPATSFDSSLYDSGLRSVAQLTLKEVREDYARFVEKRKELGL